MFRGRFFQTRCIPYGLGVYRLTLTPSNRPSAHPHINHEVKTPQDFRSLNLVHEDQHFVLYQSYVIIVHWTDDLPQHIRALQSIAR